MKDYEPIKGQWPNPDTVKCKDCIYRDKTVLDLGDKVILTGVTKDFCEIYVKGKPREILFQNAECPHFEAQ